MIEVNRQGKHSLTNWELYSLHLKDVGELSDVVEVPSRYFSCFLCWDDASDVDRDSISKLAEILLRSGCVNFSCWGKGCSEVHDIIDQEIIRQGMTGEHVIMTTWHENEPLDAALWAFLNAPAIDDGFFAECNAGIAVSINSANENKERIDYAFQFSDDFSDQVLESDNE